MTEQCRGSTSLGVDSVGGPCFHVGVGAQGIRGLREAVCLSLLVIGSACGQHEPAPEVLDLVLFKQGEQGGVFLNESLVFHFSRELERASVTDGSVRVFDASGEMVRGGLEVSRDKLYFHPEVPRHPGLMDGSFAPGGSYTVQLAGYPRLDGLRARSGEPLRGTWWGSFRTLAGDQTDGGRLFEATGGAAPALHIDRSLIAPGDAIVIVCPVALDPTSVFAEDFQLWPYEGAATEGGGPERIPMSAVLTKNSAEGARLSLSPRSSEGGGRLLNPGEYRLWVDLRSLRLRDLGGRPAVPLWASSPGSLREIRVVPSTEGPRHLEDFLSTAGRSPQAVPEADGTAFWGSSGHVLARFPISAGDGSAGRQELRGELAWVSTSAVEISVPLGERATLSSSEGLAVLRAQGRLEVAGRLVREVEGALRRRHAGESHNSWMARVREQGDGWSVPSMGTSMLGEATLSGWLAAAAEENPSWTVLIAGGDLLVSGSLQVDGPLLLAAGGRIRITGAVEAREIWKMGEGGGGLNPHPLMAPLAFEDPKVNPLREPLRLAVQSAPVRPPRGVVRWGRARAVGRSGLGRFGVSYLGERDLPQGGVELVGPVSDPQLLEGCSAVAFLIELTLLPGERWDPPVVDRVELTWVEPPSELR